VTEHGKVVGNNMVAAQDKQWTGKNDDDYVEKDGGQQHVSGLKTGISKQHDDRALKGGREQYRDVGTGCMDNIKIYYKKVARKNTKLYEKGSREQHRDV
jgi:hypothetical protein